MPYASLSGVRKNTRKPSSGFLPERREDDEAADQRQRDRDQRRRVAHRLRRLRPRFEPKHARYWRMRGLARRVAARPRPATCRSSRRRSPRRSSRPIGLAGDSRPLAITAIRSQISNSSSSSSEITRTAVPALRRSISAWRMNAAAPTSTPHVGCDDDQHFRPQQDLAPDDEFLQVAAGQRPRLARRAAALDVVLLDARARRTRAPRRDRSGRALEHRRAASPSAARCSASDIRGTAPRPSRSSGTKPRPRLRRRPGGSRPASVPQMRTDDVLGDRRSRPTARTAARAGRCPTRRRCRRSRPR